MALEPPSTPTTAPAVAVAMPAVARPVIWLQVGAYGEDANANKVRARLAAAGLSSTTIVDSDGNGKKLIKIRVGPFDDVTQADAAAVALDALDLKQYKTVIE
jgi:cell division protein FtsN